MSFYIDSKLFNAESVTTEQDISLRSSAGEAHQNPIVKKLCNKESIVREFFWVPHRRESKNRIAKYKVQSGLTGGWTGYFGSGQDSRGI